MNCTNTTTVINLTAVSIVRYMEGITKWRKDKLEDLDRKTRKLWTTYRNFHKQGDVDRLNFKRSRKKWLYQCWRLCERGS